jgi:hypothetical protein
MRGRHERRPVLDHTAGGPADQLPGHLPADPSAVEPQRGRPGRLSHHPLGDRPPGPLGLVGGLPGRRGPARHRGRDLRGHRRWPPRPAPAPHPPLVAAPTRLPHRLPADLADAGLRLPGTPRPAGRRHGRRPVGGPGGAAGRRGRLEPLQPTPSPRGRGPRRPGGGAPPPPHGTTSPPTPPRPQPSASPIPVATSIPGCASTAG